MRECTEGGGSIPKLHRATPGQALSMQYHR